MCMGLMRSDVRHFLTDGGILSAEQLFEHEGESGSTVYTELAKVSGKGWFKVMKSWLLNMLVFSFPIH